MTRFHQMRPCGGFTLLPGLSLQVSTVLLAPICPHTCEYVWGDLLKKEGTVLKAGWPQAQQPDFVLQQAAR